MVVRTRPAQTTSPRSREREARLRAMVEDNIRFVTRTLKKAGVPPCDLDDEVQHTFMVAARRLDDVALGSERNFLYQVALNIAAHVRRTLARRREVMDDQAPERIDTFATPEQLTGRKEMRRHLHEVAAHMSDELYEVFTLFEFEQTDMKEIAARLGLPRGTVASRLRRARVQFRKHAGTIDVAWDLGSEGVNRIEEPKVLSHGKMSELMEALLRTGTRPHASAARRLRTLAALGIAARPAPL
jgi:RNA polymerase sigma-70 factor (ECF subfamily)